MPRLSEEERRERKREYHKAYNKAHYEANKEEIKTRVAAYKKANKQKIREQKKAYYETNKEEFKAYSKAHYEANKEMYIERAIKRRVIKKKLVPKPFRECLIEKDRLVNIYKLRAIISEATGVEHHVDHMWPLSDGGPHWSGNLQIITAEENLSKSASVCEETKKVIKESLEYALQEYKKEKECT
jgi:5-methylcytosine-specific restriction endonuclease McrA